jgi:hypothetical protein
VVPVSIRFERLTVFHTSGSGRGLGILGNSVEFFSFLEYGNGGFKNGEA